MILLAEPPTPGPLWTGQPRPEDVQDVQLYSAALEAIQFLTKGWTRQSHRCDLDIYEPAVVRHHLRHWNELASLAEATSSPGSEAIGTAGEVDARRTLISIKADLEQGTDHGLYTILNWRQAERIYQRQNRQSVYDQRYAHFRVTWREEFTREPSAPLAEAVCIERIARSLGWYPHAVCEDVARDLPQNA